MSDTGQIAAVAKLVAQPGRRDELVNALKALIDATADEPGTLMYTLHTQKDDDNTVWFYELYADQAALSAHSHSEAMKAVGGALGGLLGGAPEITLLTPVVGKGR